MKPKDSPSRRPLAPLAVALVVALTASAGNGAPEPGELTPPATAVTASGQQGGHLPAHLVDGDPTSFWSAAGDGQWVMFDLGRLSTVARVRITFPAGAPRARFDLLVASEGDTAWRTAWSGRSSGVGGAEETFDPPDQPARWLLYFGHGNEVDLVNAVAELRIFAPVVTPPPPDPIPPPPGNCQVPAGSSALWQNFVNAKKNGSEPTLPDFSYAGYRRSEVPIPDHTGPIFDVKSFGAVADDAGFDDVAIQKAIDAAEARGGGVVLFPAGRYLVNPTETSSPITVQGSGIVLRGAGAGAGGTEILMVAKKSGGKMFRIGPAGGWGASTVATVTARAGRETFWLTVDSTAKLAPGHYVVLKHQSPAYNDFYYRGLALDPDWTRVVQGGVGVHEMHEVAEIAGNRVRFKEPLHFEVRLDDKPWRLDRVKPLTDVGIEDLRFTGSWDTYPETFVHHKDWIHDSGWSLLSLRETVHAFVRRVEFRHFNDALTTDSVGWITAENLRFSGKKGHSSVGGRRGYGMLVKDTVDSAGTHHGPDTGYNLVGAVYLRFQMNPNASVDNHGGVPHANLLDDVTGGVLSGNGGPLPNYPHTGRYYTLWNFRHRSSGNKSYDFWNPVNRNSNTFALPLFAGFTADRTVTFQSESTEVQVNESFGTRVTPTSLFEAQLALRLCR